MKLDRVDIKNFRSIASLRIELEPRCRILVGLNESGKSNILSALSLLSESTIVDDSDLREIPPEEDVDQDAHVHFVFRLDQSERNIVAGSSEEVIYPKKAPIISLSGKHMNLHEFALSIGEGLYAVNLRTKKKFYTTWNLSRNHKIIDGWLKPSSSMSASREIILPDGESVKVENISLIHKDYIGLGEVDLFVQASLEDVTKIVNKFIRNLVQEKKPDCTYWKYSNEYLLPSQINIQQFLSNPDICKPLRQMFLLAGYQDINRVYVESERRNQGVRNLLEKVAFKSTEHLRNAWPENGSIEISLRQNGLFIDATIKDEVNHYSFENRSDGFKRFVSFLLLVSAKDLTNELDNCLYLQDEPDLGLHPSGVKYLRDELIRISQKNYVVVSTHSIFMIDKERVERHLIVSKKNEKTAVNNITASNIIDEEVIYKALGHSVFDEIKPVNIIFEGWRDKRLFKVYCSGSSQGLTGLSAHRKSVGYCHARGTKDMPRVIGLLDLLGRKYHIVSDGDKPAKEQQKKFTSSHESGSWLRYDAMLNETLEITAEDLIMPKSLSKYLNQVLSEISVLKGPDDNYFEVNRPAIECLRTWLLDSGQLRVEVDKIIESWKSKIFDNLVFSDINPSYKLIALKIISMK